jgi:hypothetical protein
MENLQKNKAIDAIIHFKSGKSQYGSLMDLQPQNDNYYFIPNESVSHFNGAKNSGLAEIIPGILIEAIESDLR